MSDDLSIIERVFKRNRSKALRSLAMSVIGLALMTTVFRASPVVIGIVVGLNLVSGFVLARRAWRLRGNGSVMTAIRARPEDITSVHQWPLKLPPNRQPLALEIRTRDGGVASVLLDPRQHEESAALVAALRARAPTADVVYPTTNAA